MTAYWLARAKINNSAEYKKYTDKVPENSRAFSGPRPGRGGDAIKYLEGSSGCHRFVVIEFPTLELAVACHRSAEYQAAAQFRRDGVGENELIIVEGGNSTPV